MNTSARRLVDCHGSPYMPINLKGVLQNFGQSQRTWCAAVMQMNGRPLSHSAATSILNWNTWPKLTPAHSIREQTEAWLVSLGATEEDLKDVWAVDTGDRFRMQHPAGVHIGQGMATHHDIDPEESPENREMLSPEARKHFSLFRDPFQDDIQSADDVFLSDDQRYIREAMYSTAKHGGFIAIIGESGSGKTTLYHELYDRIVRERARVRVCAPSVVDVELSNMRTRLTARRILESLLSTISDERPRQSMQRLTDQVRDALNAVTSGESGASIVLLVEEAHRLYPGTLKSIKSLLELKHGHGRLFGVILIGQPELSHLLDETRHPELREVIRRCEVATLAPLDRHLEEYLDKKFKRVGADIKKLIAPDAFDAMRQVKGPQMRPGGVVAKPSQLYPLVVNNLVTRALNRAAQDGEDLVTGDVIRAL